MESPTIVYLDGKDENGDNLFAILKDYKNPIKHFTLLGYEEDMFVIEVSPKYKNIHFRIAGCFVEGSNFKRDCSDCLGLSSFDKPKGIKIRQGNKIAKILAKENHSPWIIRSRLRKT